jgi:twinkle protein
VRDEKIYSRPIWTNRTELSDKVVKWFESRGISQHTVNKLRITEGDEWMPQDERKINTIQFNYFRDNELINIKYRTGNKHFKLYKDAELILYNLDAIKETNECIIVEGEMDCLALIECGFENVVSVPNGAGNNLQYIDTCFDYLENKTKIILAVDADKCGIDLRNELIRRLGAERCYIADFEGEKDANDMLIKHGRQPLIKAIRNASEIKQEGIFQVSDIEENLDNLWHDGLPKGVKLGYKELDEHISFITGRLCVVTGIPGHGKSEFIDDMCVRLNIMHGWKVAYFSPENLPLQLHVSKIISRIAGKHFDNTSIMVDEYVKAKAYVNDNFSFIMPEDDYTLDNILVKTKYQVRKMGIKIFVLDPWSNIEQQIPYGINEHQYIGQCLVKMRTFAQKNDILFILSAHPRKMNRKADGKFELPTMYDIAGSSHFFNHPDYGITIYRDKELEEISIHVQKVKFKHLGGTGSAQFKYHKQSGRFAEYNPQTQELLKFDEGNWLNVGIGERTRFSLIPEHTLNIDYHIQKHGIEEALPTERPF